ncbi:MAG: hypothetical protein K9H25_12255 [Rhodospirillum sp.]|nr:hypothetical protein [Rhodospirillum sp.]MCF8490024.1 hypothetical protein [Rhodospirillum sp.]
MTPSSAPPPRDPGTISVELDKVTSLIATAQRLVGENRAVDLSALEGKVASICGAVADLPREDARRFLSALESLITGLDQLESALRRRYGPLFDPPEGPAMAPARAAKAARAYDALDGTQPTAHSSGDGS